MDVMDRSCKTVVGRREREGGNRNESCVYKYEKSITIRQRENNIAISKEFL